jgi:hypothetical protein
MLKEARGEVLRYIENEKNISFYKISILEKHKSPNNSHKRILDIEREFVNLPLEDMNFEDAADVAAAILIYRTSRKQFYETYNIPQPYHLENDKAEIASRIGSKVEYLKKIVLDYTTTKIQEVNPVQNYEIYHDLAKKQAVKNGTSFEVEKKILDKKNLHSLMEIEPVTLAKKRARIQTTLYCIGKVLERKLSTIQSLEGLKESDLDLLIEKLHEEIFSYYNESLDILPSLTKGTMGENYYLNKLHPLQNVLDFSKFNRRKFPSPAHDSGILLSRPLLGNLLFDSKKTIVISPHKDEERMIQNKVFGILLPIPREGNEKMTLLYKDIQVDGRDISYLFDNSFSNTKAMLGKKKIYYKSILMYPFWKLLSLTKNNLDRKLLFDLVGLNLSLDKEIDLNNQEIIQKINNHKTDFINISPNSRILSAKTRSEEEGLSEIFSIINSKISEIKEDFKLLK